MAEPARSGPCRRGRCTGGADERLSAAIATGDEIKTAPTSIQTMTPTRARDAPNLLPPLPTAVAVLRVTESMPGRARSIAASEAKTKQTRILIGADRKPPLGTPGLERSGS